KATHRGDDLVQPERLRVEHRSTTRCWKAVAGQVHNVDIARTQRNAFGQDARGFVDQGIDAAFDDFSVVDLARNKADLNAIGVDQCVDLGIANRRAAAALVAIPALAALLAESPQLDHAVTDTAVSDLRFLEVA